MWDANALIEAKKKFKDKVYTVGVDIGTPPEHLSEQDLNYVDEYVTTPMEFLPLEWNNRFDYIASLQGLRYTFFPFRALSEVARVLKPNGNAFIDACYDAHYMPCDINEGYAKWEEKIKKLKLDDENYKSNRITTDAPVSRFMAKTVDNYHDNIFKEMTKIYENYGITHNIRRDWNNTWGWMVNHIEMSKR